MIEHRQRNVGILVRVVALFALAATGLVAAETSLGHSSAGVENGMTITRINNFAAKPGLGDELFGLIDSFLPYIRESDGCVEVKILRDIEDPDQIVVIEVWRDQEAHRASAANVPEGTFPKAMALMSGPPTGAYYK